MIKEFFLNNLVYSLKFIKNLSKFIYVISMVMTNLLYNGFCQPKDQENENKDKEENEEDGEFVDGMGIGEGQGG